VALCCAAGLGLACTSTSTITGTGTERSDAERFCGEIGLDPAAVVSPPLANIGQLEAMLGNYRKLADLAPVAIEAEFRAVLTSLETANTVVPGDADSLRRVAALAFATEGSAVAVQKWVLANCAIDIGPVATVAAHDRPGPALDDSGTDEPSDGPSDGPSDEPSDAD
jgi:hypothetical protein